MERFAIKIDKSLKARLKNLCRLCGIDNPNQIEILNAAEWIDLTIEGEVPLNRKIADCVGIEVLKNDRMPQRICALCVDKINDFYEFRDMCHATNVQTRKLLNLPDVTKAKASKKVTIKTEEDGIESILGISGSGEKPKSEPVQKGGKKSKKGATSTTVSTSNDANRFRGMTKREIEITLELERIKKEEEEEEANPRSQLTVPPLTIRIKKEVIRPGYGDEFDINLARNIKQERVDETYELASTSTSAHSSKQDAKKKSKNLDKIKKLYKKPALLAIKIKQERMERETNDDEYNDSYPDYSMPSDDYSVSAANQSFDTTNSLPIITQIHSVIGPSSIIPMASEPPINQQLSIPINTAKTSQQVNCTPFMPIRIKSEFQRPLSPPSTTDSDATKQMNVTVETENFSICPESTMIPGIANNLTENQDKEPEKELEPSNREQESEMTHSEPQQMECDTNLIVNDVANDQPSSTVDNISKDATARDEDNNKSEIVDNQQPSESNEVAENIAPLPFSIENVVSEQNVDAISISNNELPSERQETTVKPLDNEICDEKAVEPSENTLTNHDTAVNDENVDSTSQHSMNSLEKELNILSNSSLDEGSSQPVLQQIEPSICDGKNAMDIDGTNDSSNISPIDFIEPTTNDDSLNFIDQLVHEVADTIYTQAVDKIAIINENIPVSTSNMPFEATSFNYHVDVVKADTEIRDETNLRTDESLEKPASSDIPLTVPDIPDIDCDLLPVLNAMEAKSNGNEMTNDCTPADKNPVTQVNIANLIQTDDGTVDDNNQPKVQIDE